VSRKWCVDNICVMKSKLDKLGNGWSFDYIFTKVSLKYDKRYSDNVILAFLAFYFQNPYILHQVASKYFREVSMKINNKKILIGILGVPLMLIEYNLKSKSVNIEIEETNIDTISKLLEELPILPKIGTKRIENSIEIMDIQVKNKRLEYLLGEGTLILSYYSFDDVGYQVSLNTTKPYLLAKLFINYLSLHFSPTLSQRELLLRTFLNARNIYNKYYLP